MMNLLKKQSSIGVGLRLTLLLSALFIAYDNKVLWLSVCTHHPGRFNLFSDHLRTSTLVSKTMEFGSAP